MQDPGPDKQAVQPLQHGGRKPNRFRSVRVRAVRLVLGTFGAALLACSARAPAQPLSTPPADARIVVVGDVHGAHAELVPLLTAAGVIDASLNWTGGATRLVSLGDLVDRGPGSRAVMDLLMRLQRDAPANGGAVHVLLGNHEAMNLLGDLRYVSGREYAAFAAEEPASVRDSAYARFVREEAADSTPQEARDAFDSRYPPGYFGHRLAFSPEGRYGRWLLSLPALLVIGDNAFVHGGLSRVVADAGGDPINRRIEQALRRYLSIRTRLADASVLPPWDMDRDIEFAHDGLKDTDDDRIVALLEEFLELGAAAELGPDGPLWYRGSVYCNRFLEMPVLDAALRRLGAARVVVGHTPTENRRARVLDGGRLVMLDTGMLTEYYSGRPAALIIERERMLVQYLAPEEQLPLDQGRVEAYGLTEPEIRDALAAGVIETDGDDIVRADRSIAVKVRHRATTLEASLYSGDAAALELAAHELDRLLGLQLVPPTVVRELRGRPGAVQLRYPDAISESQRSDSGVQLGDWCPLEPQFQLMYVFDALIFNTARDDDRVLYRRELPLLKLVGHDRAFGAERRLRLSRDTFMLSAAIREALRQLDESRLDAALGQWLDRRRIRALLARRDTILEQLADD